MEGEACSFFLAYFVCLEEVYVVGFSLADTYVVLVLNSGVVSSSLSKTEMELPQ